MCRVPSERVQASSCRPSWPRSIFRWQRYGQAMILLVARTPYASSTVSAITRYHSGRGDLVVTLQNQSVKFSDECERRDDVHSESYPRSCNLSAVFDLPSPSVKRWTADRKVAVVIAVSSGRVAREEVCRRYQLSVEELLAWEEAFTVHGKIGLRSTLLQRNRRALPDV